MGNSWGWLTLFLCLASVLFLSGFKIPIVSGFSTIAALFCMIMWLGVKDFFTHHPG